MPPAPLSRPATPTAGASRRATSHRLLVLRIAAATVCALLMTALASPAPAGATVSTTVTLTASSTAPVFGQRVTLVATVKAGGTTPSGTVTFTDGTSTLGTATLFFGTYSLVVSTLAVGSHPITATYAGNDTYSAGRASTSVSVAAAATTMTLSSSANPSVATQAVTLTATVSPVAPGAGTPGGTVTFRDGGTTLGTAGYWYGRYSLAVASFPAGPHAVTATFDGTASFGASSAALTQTVGTAATTTTVVASANPTVLGQSVDVFATVAAVAPASGTPPGTVTFTEGAIVRGTATLFFNRYTLHLPSLPVGSHQLTASYGGTATFAASTGSITVDVVLPRPTIAVTSSAPTSVAGQPVALVVVVGDGSSGPAPTGTLVTTVDGTPLDPATLAAGRASIALPALPVGTHAVTVTYGGDGNYQSASTTTPQVVGAAAASIEVTSSATPAVAGQPVTFTATVGATAPGRAIPTGSVTVVDGGVPIGTAALDSTGTARWTSVPDGVGDHLLTVRYAGDGQVDAASGVFVQRVTPATTTLALNTSTEHALVGQPVTMTATVTVDAPGGGIPRGTVTFTEGDTVLGSETLTDGSAARSIGPLAAGDHLITARFSGDGTFLPSTADLTQNIARVPVVLTAETASNPAPHGSTVALTVTADATAGPATPPGPITVAEGDRVLATVPVDAGVATVELAGLTAGDHTLLVGYAGDAWFAPASTTLVQHVTGEGATLTFGSSTGPVVFGEPLSYSLAVSATAFPGTPTGRVTFLDGDATLGRVDLVDGAATFAPPALGVGAHTITAAYGGDDVFAPDSVTFDQVVDPACSSLALATSDAPVVFGQPLAIVATAQPCAPSAGLPSGTVTFSDDGIVVGSATVDGSGAATLVPGTIAAGDHLLTASYAGDGSFTGSVAIDIVHVEAADADVAVSSAADTVTGEPIRVAATVVARAPSTATPAGTLTFADGPQVLLVATLADDGSLQASLPALPVGAHHVTVTYAGDGFAGAVSSFDQLVRPAASVTTVTSSANPATAGTAVTFTATVSAVAPGAGEPAGAVTFWDDGAFLGTADLAGGAATITTSGLTVGSHTVTGSYLGSEDVGASTGSVRTDVRAATAVTVSSSANPVTFGSPLSLTAEVTPLVTLAAPPTGDVTFAEGTRVMAKVALVGGRATVPAIGWAAGRHDVTVSYGGDPTSFASLGTLSVVVDPAPTIVTVVSDAQPAVYGQSGNLWAVVTTPTGDAPAAGIVTFTDASGTLGVSTLFFGRYAVRLGGLSVGTHAVTARYSGGSNFASSTASIVQTVDPAATTIRATSTANPAVATSSTTVQAVVTGSVAGAAPVGPVTFREGGTVLAVVTTPFFGRYGLPVGSLSVGSHVITASFGGSPGYLPSTTTITQTVNPAGTTVALASTANPAGAFSAGSLQASVTANAPALGTPTGFVTFTEGSVVLATPARYFNKYSLMLTDLAIGTHVITATFTGTGSFTGSSSVLSQVVVKAAPKLTVASSANPSRTRDGNWLVVTLLSQAGAVHDMTGPGGQGTVTFIDNGVTIASTPVDGNRAYLSYFDLDAGTHDLVVSYSGNEWFLPATAPVLVQTIEPQPVLAVAPDADPTCAAAVGISDSRLMTEGLYGRAARVATGAGSPLGNPAILAQPTTLQAIMGFRYGSFGHGEFVKAQKARCANPREFFTLLGPNHTLDPTYLHGDTQRWDPTDTAELDAMLDLMTGDDRYGPGGSVVVGSFVYAPNAPTWGREAAAAHDQAVLDYIAAHPTRAVRLLVIDPTTVEWIGGGEDWYHTTGPSGPDVGPTGQDELARLLFTGLAALDPDLAAPATTITLDAPASAEAGTAISVSTTVSSVGPAVTPLVGSVELFDGDAPLASVPLPVGGNTASMSPTLAEGTHHLTARFTSAGGSISSVSAGVDLTVVAPPGAGGGGATG